MSRVLLAALLLSGCAMAQPDQCHIDPAGLGKWCDGRAEAQRRPKPKEEVCDGGARACRDGEKPTGTVDDPTGYLS